MAIDLSEFDVEEHDGIVAHLADTLSNFTFNV